MIRSLRDTALVARFELVRALRTWRAVALTLLYAVATTGAALIFVGLLSILEDQLASQLGVPPTTWPGAMTHQLLENGELREILGGIMGGTDKVDALLWHPVLSLWHLWVVLLMGPFFAATAAAECISVDMGTRALRFEALRTGRLELVLGRMTGQLLLGAVALSVAAVGPFLVGVFAMVDTDALRLAASLAWFTPRAWAFSVPFVGIGVAASQLTASSAWARILAIVGVAGTWALAGVILRWQDEPWGIVLELLELILPQGWMGEMWLPGLGWVLPSVICMALGIVITGLGYLRFSGRDL